LLLAQKTGTSAKGTVSGTVWDIEHSTMLKAATVAIYLSESNELIGYRLTNQYGEFSYTELPLNIQLKFVATFIGHVPNEKLFIIKSAEKSLDLGKINLPILPININEIKINVPIPPVRMKGDTLEFYADAYKLQPNAQTEDLLRSLPGVTVWSDGAITVNGREVKGVLVNGKPFFGNDSRIATQNIPKDAVEKIQIYKKDKNPHRLTDSITEMNILLKNNKSIGYFGKISNGISNSNRYDRDITLNFFNRTSQIGAAFIHNNVNKVPNNLNHILLNSTYKGPDANIEYKSDFTTTGDHVNTAGGLQFQHDFIDKPDFNNNNRLNGSYFFSNDRAGINRATTSLTAVGNGDVFEQSDLQMYNSKEMKHEVKSAYNLKVSDKKLQITSMFISKDVSYLKENSSKTTLSEIIPVSLNNVSDQGSLQSSAYNLTASYKSNQKSGRRFWYSEYSFDNSTRLENKFNSQSLLTNYQAYLQPNNDITFDRLYNNKNTEIFSSTQVYLPNFGMLFFGKDIPFGIKIGMGTGAQISNLNLNATVEDRDKISRRYIKSSYLTNDRNEKILEFQPYLNFSKNIYRLLSNRYEKNFLAAITPELEINSLKSNSQKRFQQFSRNYISLNPKVNISFTNKIFGERISTFVISGIYKNKYPTVQQLAPLVDSVNVNFIQIGNLSLKTQQNAEFRMGYLFESENPNNISSWSFIVTTGYANNYFTDNYKIDDLGRMTYSIVNTSGFRFSRANLNYKKAIRLLKHQLQLSIAPEMTIEHTPNIVNDLKKFYNNNTITYDPKIAYNYSDKLTILISQRQTYSKSTEVNNNSNFLSSNISQSELSTSFRLFKKVTMTSNLFYIKNRYNNKSINDFFIWNASTTIKFLKAENVEIKVSGLDLLGQNKGIISMNSNNTITQGTINALQKYVMVSLSYYPRKFRK